MSEKGQDELHVFVACNEFVCAIPVRQIDRLLLSDEVRALPGSTPVPLLEVNRRAYGSFNLGRLLGLPPTQGSQVLLRMHHSGGDLPIALETGASLVVRTLAGVTTLPPTLFSSRRRAVQAAFLVEESVRRGVHGAIGLSLDLEHLLAAAEREAVVGSLRGVKLAAATT